MQKILACFLACFIFLHRGHQGEAYWVSVALTVVLGCGENYVLSLGGWVTCGSCSGWVPVAVLIEFRVLLNQEFLAAWISFIRAPL